MTPCGVRVVLYPLPRYLQGFIIPTQRYQTATLIRQRAFMLRPYLHAEAVSRFSELCCWAGGGAGGELLTFNASLKNSKASLKSPVWAKDVPFALIESAFLSAILSSGFNPSSNSTLSNTCCIDSFPSTASSGTNDSATFKAALDSSSKSRSSSVLPSRKLDCSIFVSVGMGYLYKHVHRYGDAPHWDPLLRFQI